MCTYRSFAETSPENNSCLPGCEYEKPTATCDSKFQRPRCKEKPIHPYQKKVPQIVRCL